MTASDIGGSLLVNSGDGPITVTGANQADLRSEGGPVVARAIRRGLNAKTGLGPLQVSGVAGLLTADTGGGTVKADGITAKTVQVSTNGGSATLDFSSAPQTVILDTGMGAALLQVPGGPYAVINDGGPAEVSVPTSPAAARTITVSGSDSLRISAPPGT